jgi:tRNA1Val (adenine37-N6)-methyltransferase
VNNFSRSLVQIDETLDDLRPAGLRIIQKIKGYRFSLDPILLCDFARVEENDTVADLGTGSGVIPLLLAIRTSAKRVVGVEIQPELADRARRSVLLNRLDEKVEILTGDLRALPKNLSPRSFDAVLSNPPYRRAGTGRKAPTAERAAARHELAGGIEDFLGAAALLLRHGGRFYIVYLAERLAELLSMMRRERLEPKRLRCVHSRPGDGARMVLVEGRKNGGEGLSIEPPLFIYDGERYTEEVLGIYGEVKGER